MMVPSAPSMSPTCNGSTTALRDARTLPLVGRVSLIAVSKGVILSEVRLVRALGKATRSDHWFECTFKGVRRVENGKWRAWSAVWSQVGVTEAQTANVRARYS